MLNKLQGHNKEEFYAIFKKAFCYPKSVLYHNEIISGVSLCLLNVVVQIVMFLFVSLKVNLFVYIFSLTLFILQNPNIIIS